MKQMPKTENTNYENPPRPGFSIPVVTWKSSKKQNLFLKKEKKRKDILLPKPQAWLVNSELLGMGSGTGFFKGPQVRLLQGQSAEAPAQRIPTRLIKYKGKDSGDCQGKRRGGVGMLEGKADVLLSLWAGHPLSVTRRLRLGRSLPVHHRKPQPRQRIVLNS